jgi:hypothetical protein
MSVWQAHPLVDVAVAQAWGQRGWADYTGMSRTLKKLTWSEVNALVEALERVSQPMIESELALLRAQGRELEYDGDLTGLPVSNTSRTYPNTAYGHMSDEIRLEHQAGLAHLIALSGIKVSFDEGRKWLKEYLLFEVSENTICSETQKMGELHRQAD